MLQGEIIKVKRIIRIALATFLMYIITHLIVFILLPVTLLIIPVMNEKQISQMKKNVAIILLGIVRLKPRIYGIENIDTKKKYVVIANHPSFYDILVLMTIFPDLQMIAQAFISKIPVFGYVLQKIGAYYVEPKKFMETKSSLDDAMKVQENIIIFPEGVRSDKGEIKRFHRGFVYLLRNSSLELLPITINGLYSLKPAKRFYMDPDSQVEVIIHKPITREEIEKQTENELIQTSEEIISSNYKM
jgi:1-acyl-sn-glycerol-3-phosphate acyltransferase